MRTSDDCVNKAVCKCFRMAPSLSASDCTRDDKLSSTIKPISVLVVSPARQLDVPAAHLHLLQDPVRRLFNKRAHQQAGALDDGEGRMLEQLEELAAQARNHVLDNESGGQSTQKSKHMRQAVPHRADYCRQRRTMSMLKCSASVVWLYGSQSAQMNKSSSAEMTNAPVPFDACSPSRLMRLVITQQVHTAFTPNC